MTSTGLACAACGIELPLNSRFCNECGTAVTAPAKAAEYKQQWCDGRSKVPARHCVELR
jgi:predicted amidophosphoribosyltransferase